MQFRTFGRLGWRVSAMGFGGWAVGGGWGEQSDRDSVDALHRAFDLGCNFVDTAYGYGRGKGEQVIGEAIRSRASTDRIYVATKVPPAPGTWPPGPYDRIEDRFPKGYLREMVDGRLAALGTDCIDLLQIHTWTRAWNANPTVFEELHDLRREGKILGIGVSTPEQDQNAVIDLIRAKWVDSVQLIYNIFEQEPQAELFGAAREMDCAVIVRVALDESALTGKLAPDTHFPENDVRSRYFAGDKLARTVARVEAIRAEIGDAEPSMAVAALKFALKPPAVSTVIPGIRSVQQAEANMAVADMPPLSDDLEQRLRPHMWRRGFWYDPN